ncbi:MAG: DUF3971 domain-containing protein [Xanthobacteraceae bacterium]|nr:DUF3971 domain-containing protein [Xanthobacteraceae bacterium]
MARYGRLIRRGAIGIGVLGALVALSCLALWWRLAAGPIQFDIVTPWLVSAIEENFGSNRHVEVGGTQIERTENGATAVRMRDIVVRDADGTVVASAPKAEVRLSGMSLLSGHMRAESLNLVGAEMAVRIEQDGGVTVFAGADKHPIATAAVPVTVAAALLRSAQEKRAANAQSAAALATPPGSAPVVPPANAQQPAPHRARDVFAALLSWIDGIGETGLDGHDLRELGLKNGNLTVDDQRTGKHWTFKDISLSVQRAHGGVEVTVGSDNPAGPWALTAALTPTGQGSRKIELEARRISASNLLLASRIDGGNLQIDTPLSASLSGEIGPDGLPQTFTGRVLAEAGSIGDASDPDSRVSIERAEFKLQWDAERRVLSVPFQILSGGNRITLMGQVEAPAEPDGVWLFKVGGGTVVLNSDVAGNEPLVLNRIAVSGRYDAAKRRFIVDEGDIGNSGVGVAMSGNVDFSGDVHLAAGIAGTRMPVDALKRLWPAFVTPKVRDWFDEHLISGTVDRIVIAVNSPLENLKTTGPPVPDDGLLIDALATGCVIRPVAGLPALRDADLNVHVAGRDAVVSLGKATADLPSGRKLVVSSGVFEVPDTSPLAPPARVRFKLEGPVPAAAELLHMDRLREVSDAPFDPSTIRGNLSAQVSMGMPLKSDLPPGSTNYAITVDATNFTADHLIMGQKVDAALLKASATPQGFQLKGDVKIAGSPASLEYRKARGEADAEVRIQGMLDEAARNSLGFDLGETVSGAIPIRLAGRVATTSDRESRFAVEADLTPAQIEGLLPGWSKPSGKPARATFTLLTKPQSIRIDDLLIEGASGGVKGAIEFDGSGEVQSANFPAYGFTDGDRASLRIERTADGALRVIMRGEVYDGRGFVKTAAGGTPAGPNAKRRVPDLDLDMKLGAVVGFNGEALRGLDLKMSRRAGEVRSFGLTAKIGRDATLTGDLRGRPGARQVVYLESSDAGAFFRFTDVYSRMTGGQVTIAMEPPLPDNAAQQGILSVRNFAIHDETQLERAVTSGTQPRRAGNAIDFSGMRLEFTRMPGRIGLRNGVVRGPVLGGTIDGVVDYAHDDVHLRGTLVPLYGPNNLLGQIPVVGLFMGGDKEGLFGITYEVIGRPGNPVMRVNPLSALAPGLLRKVFEFPANGDTGAVDVPR